MLSENYVVTTLGYTAFGISVVILIIVAVISLKLINGISEHNASKVNIYKWFLIVLLILFVPSTLYSTANGDMEGILTNSKSSLAIQIISEIAITLWMTYEILVIYSLEKMYREQRLPVIQQPGVVYQTYPQQQLYIQ